MPRNDKTMNILNSVDSIKIELMGLIHQRDIWLNQEDKLWDKVIKDNDKNQADAIHFAYKNIGKLTYRINGNIRSLTTFVGNAKAMDMALEYLLKEIERNEGILAYRKWVREEVREGRGSYIDEHGVVSADPTLGDNYIEYKNNTIAKLKKWYDQITENKNSNAESNNQKLDRVEIPDIDFDIIPEELPVPPSIKNNANSKEIKD